MVLDIRWFVLDAVGDAGKYWRISESSSHPGFDTLWKRWRMCRKVALGRAGLGTGGGVAAVSPVVTIVAWRNNCGCLDDLFYLCTGVADALE
jgi:hypothetical protein